ncbi:hypothetical protein AAFF_G00042340 [Aldrovandia affinis]|uniref:Uncharacterized protein n=1 Tax=Aldrovandia affinis TaxID=143900 RepID=A0AAD7S2T8_9TELE|nr:hypothetical protein AAFF_G00042340 [Aldrovandia affinis]
MPLNVRNMSPRKDETLDICQTGVPYSPWLTAQTGSCLGPSTDQPWQLWRPPHTAGAPNAKHLSQPFPRNPHIGQGSLPGPADWFGARRGHWAGPGTSASKQGAAAWYVPQCYARGLQA